MSYPNCTFTKLSKVPSKRDYARGARTDLNHDGSILFPQGVCSTRELGLYIRFKREYNPYVIFTAIHGFIPRGIGQTRKDLYLKKKTVEGCRRKIDYQNKNRLVLPWVQSSQATQ